MKRHPADFFSAQRAAADIAAIYSHARWLTTPRIMRAAQHMMRRLRAVRGLTDIAILHYPADGKTAYGGWVMPKAWDVKSATLDIVAPHTNESRLADFKTNPHSLMNWSPSTPRAGVGGEVAILEKPFEFSGSLAGKFALTGAAGSVNNDLVSWLAKRGAVGLLCDQMNWVKGVKEEAELSRATQWFNYANPQWDSAPRLPAFALTPEGGRTLRALAASGSVKLHARVDAKLYDGTFPLVTAYLPGATNQEIVLAAHMDEPGASDNASGTAMCMEQLRAFAAFAASRKKPLQRGIRFYASVEARGLQAYLNTTNPGAGKNVLAGLNIDMISYDHTDGKTLLKILAAAPHNFTYLDALLEELADAEARRSPPFRYKIERGVAVDDTHFSALPFSAPMCMVGQWPDRTYHTSVDHPKNVSRPHLQRIGRLIAEAVRFMADAEADEVLAFGERLFKKSMRAPQSPPLNKGGRGGVALSGLTRLIPEGLACPDENDVLRMRRAKELTLGHLYPRTFLQQKIEQWTHALEKKTAPPLAPVEAPSRAIRAEASRLIPLKNFAGYIAFEDLSVRERAKLKRETGIGYGWAAPNWLQWALDLANGKRSTLEIFQTLQANGQKGELKHLIAALKFLARRKQVTFRQYLTARDVSAALKRLGVKCGDLLVAHSSLSDFGYIDGGAETLIDCLLKAIGPRGTLAMPTHSLSWIGNAPYNAKTSPSFTGAVPAAFLKRKGVLRTAHPTHSVAILGPLAKALAAGHTAAVSPQSRAGFWGNFVAANGKVVLLCKPDSNTLLHSGELWADSPYPPARVHFMKNGKRVEATIPGMPWHVSSFAAVHAALKRRGQMKTTVLGESLAHSLRARDGVEEMMYQVKRDPYIVTRPNCSCRWCVYVRGQLNSRKRR
jgi:aminoglycoside 3-N-acetyltransferase